MKDDKTTNLIATKLQSKNKDEVLFTIKQLRNTGNRKILPFVIDLLHSSKSSEIKTAIINLLGDLKDKNSAIEIVSALKNEKYASIRKELLSTCWQSGLDYSMHLDLFVNLFITGSFEVAFEAFTVIDNFEEKFQAETIDPFIEELKLRVADFKKTDKEALFVELVHILTRLKE